MPMANGAQLNHAMFTLAAAALFATCPAGFASALPAG
jgi:hypothetical protein